MFMLLLLLALEYLAAKLGRKPPPKRQAPKEALPKSKPDFFVPFL